MTSVSRDSLRSKSTWSVAFWVLSLIKQAAERPDFQYLLFMTLGIDIF